MTPRSLPPDPTSIARVGAALLVLAGTVASLAWYLEAPRRGQDLPQRSSPVAACPPGQLWNCPPGRVQPWRPAPPARWIRPDPKAAPSGPLDPIGPGPGATSPPLPTQVLPSAGA